jgi:hypothetical protein
LRNSCHVACAASLQLKGIILQWHDSATWQDFERPNARDWSIVAQRPGWDP